MLYELLGLAVCWFVYWLFLYTFAKGCLYIGKRFDKHWLLADGFLGKNAFAFWGEACMLLANALSYLFEPSGGSLNDLLVYIRHSLWSRKHHSILKSAL